MKIYNNTNITYSAIEHNSRKNTKQNVPADLEKKMTQYTDTLSISKTGQESFRHLSSVSSMDYQNRFEKEVTDIFVKEDTESGSMSILWAQKVELFSQHNICRENYFLGC